VEGNDAEGTDVREHIGVVGGGNVTESAIPQDSETPRSFPRQPKEVAMAYYNHVHVYYRGRLIRVIVRYNSFMEAAVYKGKPLALTARDIRTIWKYIMRRPSGRAAVNWVPEY
jgi:hypothetical protein